MTLICLFSNGMFPSQSAPKVILHPNKDFIFIMEVIKLNKIGSKTQNKQAKHRPCMFGNVIPTWLSTIILWMCNMVCYVLPEFHGKIQKIHSINPKNFFVGVRILLCGTVY